QRPGRGLVAATGYGRKEIRSGRWRAAVVDGAVKDTARGRPRTDKGTAHQGIIAVPGVQPQVIRPGPRGIRAERPAPREPCTRPKPPPGQAAVREAGPQHARESFGRVSSTGSQYRRRLANEDGLDGRRLPERAQVGSEQVEPFASRRAVRQAGVFATSHTRT